MTKEELLKKIDFEKNWLYECGIFGSDVDIAFHAIKKSVIEALEQEPCEDAISRQAVIDDLEKSHMTSGVHNQGTWNECVDSMIHTVRSMPSVNPQEPVLDKIRAEIMSKDGLEEALEIIDKYKAEREVDNAK